MAQPITTSPATITVEEAAERLGVSLTLAYKAAKTGQLPVVRVGRRMLVPLAAFERMLGIEPSDAA